MESKLLVWICIYDKGISPPIFQKSGLAVNKSVYLDKVKRGLVIFIEKHHSDGKYKFSPDLASSHYAKVEVYYFRAKKINLVQKIDNPAQVQEARPIEDFWSILKGYVFENDWRAKNLDELKNKIRLCIRNLDPALVQRLMATSSRRLIFILNKF